MEYYTSPDDALSDLKKRGYEADPDTDSFCLYCSALDLRLNPGANPVDADDADPNWKKDSHVPDRE